MRYTIGIWYPNPSRRRNVDLPSETLLGKFMYKHFPGYRREPQEEGEFIKYPFESDPFPPMSVFGTKLAYVDALNVWTKKLTDKLRIPPIKIDPTKIDFIPYSSQDQEKSTRQRNTFMIFKMLSASVLS